MVAAAQELPRLTEGRIRIASSLLDRAKRDDSQALIAMFSQFIPPEEQVAQVAYFGVQGWLFGKHSFACLTDKRAASLKVGSFGEVVYQDGYHEFINSGVVYQPSRLWLFVVGAWLCLSSISAAIALSNADAPVLVVLATLLLGALLLVYWPKIFYRMVLWVREGVPVYLFSNRNRIMKANSFYRHVTDCRERRVHALKR